MPNYFASKCPAAFLASLRFTASGFTVHSGDRIPSTTAKEDARQLNNEKPDTESFSVKVVDNTHSKNIVLKLFA